MTTFAQFHMLTSYSAANLNRDDTGRPKTMTYGGANRLRVSSQSLKRAGRTSDGFKDALGSQIGVRSNKFALDLLDALKARGVDEETAIKRIVAVLTDSKVGKLKKPDKEKPWQAVMTEQLVHLSQAERDSLMGLVDTLAEGAAENGAFLRTGRSASGAADVALFGRMLADRADMNVEAACQVAHAFTTHRVAVEDDFYTAVDDLKNKAEGDDAGAGFLSVHDFGAGVFYTYVNIALDDLLANVNGDRTLAKDTVQALINAMTTVSPTGKQNSYASHARASYCLVEIGPEMPRSLAEAFVQPIPARADQNLIAKSITALRDTRENLGKVYGDLPQQTAQFNMLEATGSVSDVAARALAAIDGLPAPDAAA